MGGVSGFPPTTTTKMMEEKKQQQQELPVDLSHQTLNYQLKVAQKENKSLRGENKNLKGEGKPSSVSIDIPTSEITPPPTTHQDETFYDKLRRGSATIVTFVAAAPDPEDVSLGAKARRKSAAVIAYIATDDPATGPGKLRRASAQFVEFATEDALGIDTPGSNQVAPEPDANGAPAAKPQQLKVKLNDKSMSLLEQTVSANGEGLSCAIFAIMLSAPVVWIVKFLSVYYSIELVFVATIFAIIIVEIIMVIINASKTKNYVKRNLCSVWPAFIILNGIAIYTLVGKMGHTANPLAAAIYGLAKSATYFYDRYHGTATKSYKVYLLRGISFAYLMCFLELFPIAVQLICVHFLAGSFPMWNLVVTGFCFPIMLFFIKKGTLSKFLNSLKRSAAKRRIKEEDILPMYATTSRIISCFLLCSSIVVMYYAATLRYCDNYCDLY